MIKYFKTCTICIQIILLYHIMLYFIILYDILSWFEIVLRNMLHYGIVLYKMTLYCMICYDKKMYSINSIMYQTIYLANKIKYLIKKNNITATCTCKKNV